MFTLAGQTTSALEVAAFVSGLLSVWLTQRLNVWNWPAGIVSVACFAWLFFDASLYAAAALQLVFIVLCIYGWWSWSHDRAGTDTQPVSHATSREITLGLALAAAGTWACALLLTTRTDSPAPWPDAAVLSFSLLATWGQARRRIECWWAWIAVDLVSIPLYWSRDLPLTAALYVLFLLICAFGLRSWSKNLIPQGAPA